MGNQNTPTQVVETERRAALPAREVAVRVLADARGGRRTARNGLEDLISRHTVGPAEMALATELMLGVIRHRLTLSHVLAHSMQSKWRRLGSYLQQVLLVGAYQIIWLDGVPDFAAVHEAVEQARRQGGARAGSLVNAVLRELLRRTQDCRASREPADPRCAIPVDDNRWYVFTQPVFADPKRDPVRYLAQVASHPELLISSWISAFGVERAREICRAGTRRPPRVLRANRLRIKPDALVKRLCAEGCDAQLSSGTGGAVFILAGPPLRTLAAFDQGLCQPQDPTAMGVLAGADLKPGERVLDLCAAPGTKTTQAAEVMRNRGVVLATDRNERKLARVTANANRLGIDIVRTVPLDGLDAAVREVGGIDVILVDAPCSNTGVLARRPEARYRYSGPSLGVLSSRQRQLLARAVRLAGDRTRIIYSTCSLEPEENERVVEHFARDHLGWRLVESTRTFPVVGPGPADWRDGGFVARWVREK